MVKSVLGVKHQGLQDWVIQRVSAILMVVYSVGLIAYIVCHPGFSYAEWHGLFAHMWMKVATLLVLSGLMYHAWIGMWTIFTDYVKPFVLRSILDVLVLILLFACFFWALLILWSV
jgi:succinate dehydrogenase / fumarate reductase, membrane anchor subunit